MKIFIVGLNYSPELTGIGKYTGELAPWLARRGHLVKVITSPPYYPEWRIHPGFKNRWTQESTDGVTVYRCPLFVPSEVTTMKRILHLLSFSLSLVIRFISLWREKPDVVLLVVPTLFCAPVVWLYSRWVGARSIIHIQDFEVDAMFGLGIVSTKKTEKSFTIKRFIMHIESWILRRFDRVSTISFKMLDHAVQKGVERDRLFIFPNWTDTLFVHPAVDRSKFRNIWDIAKSDKIVLYSGNIGVKQGLELVLDVATRYRFRTDVHFFMVGAGAYWGILKKLAHEKKLSNVHFKPLVPWKELPALLAMADVHLVIQRKGVADAVLPSKLTNILSIGGNAIVTAEKNTELSILADRYPGIYTCIIPEDSDTLYEALEIELAKTRQNEVARQYALKNLEKEKVLGEFELNLKQLIER